MLDAQDDGVGGRGGVRVVSENGLIKAYLEVDYDEQNDSPKKSLWKNWDQNYNLTTSVYSYPYKLKHSKHKVRKLALFTKETQVVDLITQAFIFFMLFSHFS
jgi:hypothetical protein